MRLLQYLNYKNRGSCSRTFRIVGEENVDDGVSWAEAAEVYIFYDNGDCISVCNAIGLHGAARVQR